ncbi:MAG: DUF4115 domain-containing protein, partial [Thermodesulfobacteriota bacterium]
SGELAKNSQPEVTTVRPGPRALPPETPDTQEDVRPVRESRPPRAGKLMLEIKATAKAWVRVQSDAGPAEEMVMLPGQSRFFTAKQGFQVQTGNAGGVRIRFDGKDLQKMGEDNQTLAITLP